MLSNVELKEGVPFVLKLWNSAGVSSQWLEILKGETAKEWYEIYQSSNWEALRKQAAGVFKNSMSEAKVQTFFKTRKRCIFIHTLLVKVEQLHSETAPVAPKKRVVVSVPAAAAPVRSASKKRVSVSAARAR